MAEWQRTHTCGDLNDGHDGLHATLNGWVLTTRNYGNQVFADVRDRYGLTQVVFEADDTELFAAANELGREHCVAVSGTVRPRIKGKERHDIPTGRVELKATRLTVLNATPPLPFSVTEFPDEELANEDLRLQYRYLDLRRKSLRDVLLLRNRINKVIRDTMDARQFVEVETPLLGKSTPEGARDYLVPSRVYNGEFFALPQSPQLYKQLLMVAGFDRYYQIARCLRDEDLRADRQPEFTQLDVEMSFVEQDDILELMEGLTAAIFKACLGVDIPLPMPRISYADAMRKYGSDKPDLRFGLEIVDVGDIAAESDFTVFKNVLAAGGVVRGINAKGAADKFSNSALKPGGELPKVVETYKAKGLAWMKYEGDKFTGSIEKFFPDAVKARLKERLNVAPGDLVMFVADKEAVAAGQPRGAAGVPCPEARADRPATQGLPVRVGRGLPDVHVGRGGQAVGGQPPPVHRPEGRGPAEAGIGPRVACGRRRMTSSATATRSAAAASGSTARTCRAGCSPCSVWRPTTPRPGSGSCSTRSTAGPRRTEGSRSGWTAGA